MKFTPLSQQSKSPQNANVFKSDTATPLKKILKANSNQQSPSPMRQNANRTRSNTVKAEQNSAINPKKSQLNSKNVNDCKTQSQKKVFSPVANNKKVRQTQQQPKISTLIDENMKLKVQIQMLQQLIQEVVPVFSKITEDCHNSVSDFKTLQDEGNTRKSLVNIQINQQDFQKNKTQELKTMNSTESLMKRSLDYEQVGVIHQSLQQLQSVLEHRQSLGQVMENEEIEYDNEEETEFLEAEDLDMTTTDERQVNLNSPPNGYMKSGQGSNYNQNFNQQFKSNTQLTFGGNNSATQVERQLQLLSQRSNMAQTQGSNQIGQRVNTQMNQKTKISDLNKQSKNYNMPVNLDFKQLKKEIINYEELQQIQVMIDQISNSDILQEIKQSRKATNLKNNYHRRSSQNHNASNMSESRNCNILDQSNSSCSEANLSAESLMSDDNASIPTDSLITKNVVSNHQICRQSVIKDLNQQVFKQFSMLNNKIRNQVSTCTMKPEMRNNNLIYPSNFNSCLSVDSNGGISDAYFSNEQIVKPQDAYLQHKNIAEQPKQQMDTMIDIDPNDNDIIEEKLAQIDISNRLITENPEEQQQVQRQNLVSEQSLKGQSSASSRNNMNQYYKVQCMHKDYQKMQLDYPSFSVQELHCQSQSKDGNLFTSSIFLTDQIALNTKACISNNTVDPVLQNLMINESPLREACVQDSLQHSEKKDFKHALGHDDSHRYLAGPIENFTRNNRSKLRQNRSTGKDKENQSSREKSLVSNIGAEKFNSGNTESTPALQILNINQEIRPVQDQISARSSHIKIVRNSLSSHRSAFSSKNNSPTQIKKQTLRCKVSNGQTYQNTLQQSYNSQQCQKSLKMRQILQDNQQVTNSSDQHCKWQSLEEKEMSLVTLNKKLIQRSQESKASLQVSINEVNCQFDMINQLSISPQNKLSEVKIIQTQGKLIQNEESFEASETTTFNLSINKHNKQNETFQQQNTSSQEQEVKCDLVIENFFIQPILNERLNSAASNRRNIQDSAEIIDQFSQEILPIQTPSLPSIQVMQENFTEHAFNQTFNANNNINNNASQNLPASSYINSGSGAGVLNIHDTYQQSSLLASIYLKHDGLGNTLDNNNSVSQRQESQQREKFIQEYKIHQKVQLIHELDRLSTPSPRNIKDVIQSQTPFEVLQEKLGSLENSRLVREESMLNDHLNTSSINEAQGDTYGDIRECTPETETLKTSHLDQLMMEYLKDAYQRLQERNSLGSQQFDGGLQSSQKSHRSTISPTRYQINTNTNQSSQDFVEICANEVRDENQRIPFKSNTSQLSKQHFTIYEYASQNSNSNSNYFSNFKSQPDTVKILNDSGDESPRLIDLKVVDQDFVDYKEEVQSQRNYENNRMQSIQSIINEEPSLEEQESNAFQNKNSQKFSRRESERASSRISLTQIDMVESEMFSQNLNQQSVIGSSNCQMGSFSRPNQSSKASHVAMNQQQDTLSNYSSNQYKTPLRQLMYSESNSICQAKVSPNTNFNQLYGSISSSCQNFDVPVILQQSSCKNSILLKNNLLSPVLKQDKSSSKSPIRLNQDVSKSQDKLNEMKQQIHQQESQNNYYYQGQIQFNQKRDESKQNQQDYSIDNQRRQITIQKSLSHQKVQQQSQQNSLIQSIKTKTNRNQDKAYQSSHVQRKYQKEDMKQKELEQRFKEKEEKIQQILLKKKETDERIHQQKLQRDVSRSHIDQQSTSVSRNTVQGQNKSQTRVPEIISNNNNTIVTKNQPSSISLSKGQNLLVRTPQKIILQKQTNVPIKETFSISSSNHQSRQRLIPLKQCSNQQSMNLLQTVLSATKLGTDDTQLKTLETKNDNSMMKDQTNIIFDTVGMSTFDSQQNRAQVPNQKTERVTNYKNRDAMSPLTVRVDPMTRQNEFFQKLENDSKLRQSQIKIQPSTNKFERLTLNKLKQQSVL
ncbi:UNKNOWN [Stylonychia lemnae]|uniref:Uncharacterized protein n=1 Tax=Stylonychia lemnae TaxID=5949 RepID=A0A078A2L2_STYLE|nr:UNKNOWN [Stylonychia lemnae]|eukprot:CDW76062.1 UNKNOWN [Stylonychia lemnae]